MQRKDETFILLIGMGRTIRRLVSLVSQNVIPDTSQNPQNWSRAKKFWVTFEICILTFSVYVGSAIYTAGLIDVTQEFGVSRVAATLGLTLFVLGYATGPMLW